MSPQAPPPNYQSIDSSPPTTTANNNMNDLHAESGERFQLTGDNSHDQQRQQESLRSFTSSSNSTTGELHRLVLTAATTAATLGYDVGIMAAAIQPLEVAFNLSPFQKELAMGSLNFMAAAGALVGGKVADPYGRKWTLQLCCYLFLVGTLCMAFAINYATLLIGRIVTGMGVGVAFVVAPV